MQYWLVKGKPTWNDLRSMIKKGKTTRWVTARPPKLWEVGDRLFFWEGAPVLRIVGLGLLESIGTERDGNNRIKFGVRYLCNYIESGPSITELRGDSLCGSASFLKAAVAGTVFPLTPDQGQAIFGRLPVGRQRLSDLWPDLQKRKDPPLAKPEPVEIGSKVSPNTAWFGTPESNKVVEKAAVDFVIAWYKRAGWSVQSREAENCGYDLLCKKNGDEEHVEVKGISGNGIGFLISANEVECARRDPKFVLAAVTNAGSLKPQLHRWMGAGLEEAFCLIPITYRASVK